MNTNILQYCLINGVTFVQETADGIFYQTDQQIAEGLDRANFVTWFGIDNIVNDKGVKIYERIGDYDPDLLRNNQVYIYVYKFKAEFDIYQFIQGSVEDKMICTCYDEETAIRIGLMMQV